MTVFSAMGDGWSPRFGFVVLLSLVLGQGDLLGQNGVPPTGVPDWLDLESFDRLLGATAQRSQQAPVASLGSPVKRFVLETGPDYRKVQIERALSDDEEQLREKETSLGFLVDATEEELRRRGEDLQKHRRSLELLQRRLGRLGRSLSGGGQVEIAPGVASPTSPVVGPSLGTPLAAPSLPSVSPAPVAAVSPLPSPWAPEVDPGSILIVDPPVDGPIDEVERAELEIRESGLKKLVARLEAEQARDLKHLEYSKSEKRRIGEELRLVDASQDAVRTSVVTEVATGLNYWDAQRGAWQASQAEIEIIDGVGVARQGRHKVLFAPRISARGAVELYAEGGERLRFNVLGLGYFDEDTGQSVILAEVRPSEGRLVGKNQLVYEDALQGEVTADVRYTYSIHGLEQDVILKGAMPPGPEAFGLNPDSTRFEVLTELLNPPAASVSMRVIPQEPLSAEQEAESVSAPSDGGGVG